MNQILRPRTLVFAACLLCAALLLLVGSSRVSAEPGTTLLYEDFNAMTAGAAC
ncbi:hypothetical protein [Paenibacillus koleovorans]|uniref:hypothetical protein n=1 Tax=Paenibacillus koleovorans TaxID=121608 RepID=UPI0013E2E981|nr:hypothetical protein [Paenibacillus koleovorans]